MGLWWSWKGFGRGIVKGIGYVAIGAGVGVVIVAALPASAATVAITTFAVVGATGVGLTTGQVITGRTLTGEVISGKKRSEMAGEALVGWATIFAAKGWKRMEHTGGYEKTWSQDFRTGWHPIELGGKKITLPHYHRRIKLPSGETAPGGGIGWHRPWQKGF